MKNRRRALRRHHRQRMLKRTRGMLVLSSYPEAEREIMARYFYKNRAKCACMYCHVRELRGKSNQERRQEYQGFDSY